VARNILLAERTGARLHCQHLSAAGSVQLIREARQRGVRVSGEACPHHFILTDRALAGGDEFWGSDGQGFYPADVTARLPRWPGYDTTLKMNPPVRSATDREAILAGLSDGTIEVLASDHAPRNYEKEVEFDQAPFGITGLETELALSLMHLVHSGRLSLPDDHGSRSIRPAVGPGRQGTLAPGSDGDVTVFDRTRMALGTRPDGEPLDEQPFYGWPLRGKALATIVGGRCLGRRKVDTRGRLTLPSSGPFMAGTDKAGPGSGYRWRAEETVVSSIWH
jgi:dihydroorotase